MNKFWHKKIHNKFFIVTKVSSIVFAVILLKLLFHYLGWEIISINPLFSGIVAADVFLMGFLISGVLTDYKESERLPGELVTCISAITDEAAIIHETKNEKVGMAALDDLSKLSTCILEWFYKREKTEVILDLIKNLSVHFSAFEPLTQANFIARLKQEQSNIRRIIIRVHTIRETSFVSLGYFIAKTTTILLICGLVFSRIEPIYESLFFVGVISFLLIFLLFMIHEIDNPFSYYNEDSAEVVSLKPLEDLIARNNMR